MVNHEVTAREALAHMTPEDFANMGAPHLAYVAPMATDEGPAFGIHAANGNLLGVVRSRDLAFAAARQNDLEPVSVH
jgi:hypothetical protein